MIPPTAQPTCPVLDFDHHALGPDGRAEVWQELLKLGPIFRSTQYGGFWVVGGHAEAAMVLRHDELFSSARSGDGQGGQAIPPFPWPRPNIPGEYDGEEHSRLKRTFLNHLSPAVVRSNSERVRTIVGETFDAFAGEAEVDVLQQIAVPIPAHVMFTLLGLDTQDALWMGVTVHEILTGAADLPRRDYLLGQLHKIEAMMLEQVDERRGTPRPDIISAYANVRDKEGRLLGAEDLLSVLVNSFLFGGLGCSDNLITSAIA